MSNFYVNSVSGETAVRKFTNLKLYEIQFMPPMISDLNADFYID